MGGAELANILAENADRALNALEEACRGASFRGSPIEQAEYLASLGTIRNYGDWEAFAESIAKDERFNPFRLPNVPLPDSKAEITLEYPELGAYADIELVPDRAYGAKSVLRLRPNHSNDGSAESQVWEWEDLNHAVRLILAYAIASTDRLSERWEFF